MSDAGLPDEVRALTGTAALRGVVGGSVPAARVRPTGGGPVWFLDAAAARSLG